MSLHLAECKKHCYWSDFSYCIFRSIQVSRWQNQQILEDFFDGSRIIEISLSDRMGLQLYTKVADLMNRDLGQDRPVGAAAAEEITSNSPCYFRFFIFIEGTRKTAVGCCVAEELTAATVSRLDYHLRRLAGGRQSLLSWRIQNSTSGETDKSGDCLSHFDEAASPSRNSNNKEDKISNSSLDKISYPLCGIRRLWVAAKHRRRGVATALLDCVLKNLIYLTHIPRSHVAFSEPTASGADFAVKFVGREDFIIY